MTTERRLTIGVRARILATVLLLAALGMAFAGSAFTVFERRQLIDHLDSVLLADVGQFRQEVDQNTSQSMSELLQAVMGQHVPVDGEVVGGFIDGNLTFVTSDPAFQITKEPDLLAQVAALPPDAPTRIRQLDSVTAGPVRYVVMQLQNSSSKQVGSLVVAISLKPALERLTTSATQFAVLAMIALVIIGVGGWLVAGRLLRPLRVLREATQAISPGDLNTRIPVTGRDDVTQLTRTVNAMLDRLAGAFDTQQRFLDDAGHELRTPITIVQGHLEVLDPADPAEVEATRDLVMDELDRMGRLVNDLIVLAQTGRPDFVRFESVDLDRLLRDVFDKAQALADRHWVLDSTINAVVVADAHRLTQAMLQLTDNAVRHTQPDDVVAVGGVLSRGQVQLWVRDSGPGVAPEDAERIFARFGRAGVSRGETHSSGLGLSIVSSIAAAHGGTVELSRPTETPPGRQPGARFTLIMPLTVVARTQPPSPWPDKQSGHQNGPPTSSVRMRS
ncbi:MAG: HAMP domain-containing protein [Kineosporiaceae bacterium]|nr:HAMP domain-containing protein [Kineosporiaceae bacterium]MBK8074014.1 HAMP domain-containing protein [Kineosporiaceae bacterium]